MQKACHMELCHILPHILFQYHLPGLHDSNPPRKITPQTKPTSAVPAPEVSFCKVVPPPPFHAIAPKSSKAKESPLLFADFELSKAVSRFAQWENALAVASTKFFSKMDNFTNHMNSLMATIIHLQSQV